MNDAYDPIATVAHNCVTSPVTTTGWTEIFPGHERTIRSVASFNSTGRILSLSRDAVSVLPFTVIPGGDIPQEFLIDGGAKLYAKAVDGIANDGYIVLNLFG